MDTGSPTSQRRPPSPPVTEDTAFRIASITKTFTAIVVMQLWEQGLVDLDAAANDHLRAYQLVPATETWRPATLRHLLADTAGIPKLVHPSRALLSGWFGERRPRTARASHRGLPPDGFPLVAEPGTTFNYTDHSIATVGVEVRHRYGPGRVRLRPGGSHDMSPPRWCVTALRREESDVEWPEGLDERRRLAIATAMRTLRRSGRR